MIKLERSPRNPILSPTKNPWENLLVFNPAVIRDQGIIHMLYRCQGYDNISRLGYAFSRDGIDFQRFDHVAYQGGGHQFEKLGIEDPRMVKIDSVFYIVYTAVSEVVGGTVQPDWKERIAKRIRVSAASTTDFRIFNDYDVIIPDTDAKNASLFPRKVAGQFWLFYRNPKNETYFSHSEDLRTINKEPHFVFKERPGMWDSQRTGIGAPPIETDLGWLLLYHGVDEKNVYRLGVMLLDKNHPQRILYRSDEPILEPETEYEEFGFFPNVVFSCGAVEFNNRYFVYYGAADQTVCLATIGKNELLNTLKQALD